MHDPPSSVFAFSTREGAVPYIILPTHLSILTSYAPCLQTMSSLPPPHQSFLKPTKNRLSVLLLVPCSAGRRTFSRYPIIFAFQEEFSQRFRLRTPLFPTNGKGPISDLPPPLPLHLILPSSPLSLLPDFDTLPLVTFFRLPTFRVKLSAIAHGLQIFVFLRILST